MKLPAYQDLSKEQEAINNLPLSGSYLVTGPPGTGKTVIALYRSQLVEGKGGRAQLLMYNGLLMRYTAAALADLQVGADATTYLKWLHHLFPQKFHVNVPYPEPYTPDWTFVIQTLKDAGPDARVVESLVVDEGQDLPPRFYEAAVLLADNVTVFADENQTIDERKNSTFEQIRAGLGPEHRMLRLNRNYRNTLQIAKLADVFYTGTRTGIAELPEKTGPKPQIRRTKSLDEAISLIRTYEANNNKQEIGVFVNTRNLVKRIHDALQGTTKNPIHSYLGNKDSGTMDLGVPGIRIMCSESAKGLEFDAVFMPEIQDFMGRFEDETALRRRFYVMTSRARESLFMLYSGASRPAILSDLSAQLVDEKDF